MPAEPPAAGSGGQYPYQVPIEAYGNGGFRFAGMSHRGSLFCLGTGMFAWQVTEPAAISAQTLAPALLPDAGLEVFFVGTGDEIVPLPPKLRQLFRDRSIIVEPMSTGSAARTYNVLLAENRAVGAALIAVDKAR
jgi:uncharacterized protein